MSETQSPEGPFDPAGSLAAPSQFEPDAGAISGDSPSPQADPLEDWKAAPPTENRALRQVTGEIEAGAARLGWDRPAAIYALVPTTELMETPGIPPDILENLQEAWDGSSTHLSAILQEDVSEDVEEVLPQLAWPDTVYGAALTIERIMVPPAVEEEAPDDPEEALEFIASHPARMDVRLTVGVTRDGDSWCEVRMRDHDDPLRVAKGENLVPALVEALKMGFLPAPEG